MRIHNQIEDLVLEIVSEIFESREITEKDICTCSQCRLDVACFALNRLAPEYIISSRGLAHLNADYHMTIQKTADVTGLVKKGLEIVSSSTRPGFKHDDHVDKETPDSPTYNFPIISGRIFNGQNFIPLLNQKIHLTMNGEEVPMFDNNWQNPYPIVPNVPGNFMFWPAPIEAETSEDKKSFSFSIKLRDPDFSEFTHRFSLDISAETRVINSLQVNRTYNMKDLYIFRNDYVEEGLEP